MANKLGLESELNRLIRDAQRSIEQNDNLEFISERLDIIKKVIDNIIDLSDLPKPLVDLLFQLEERKIISFVTPGNETQFRINTLWKHIYGKIAVSSRYPYLLEKFTTLRLRALEVHLYTTLLGTTIHISLDFFRSLKNTQSCLPILLSLSVHHPNASAIQIEGCSFSLSFSLLRAVTVPLISEEIVKSVHVRSSGNSLNFSLPVVYVHLLRQLTTGKIVFAEDYFEIEADVSTVIKILQKSLEWGSVILNEMGLKLLSLHNIKWTEATLAQHFGFFSSSHNKDYFEIFKLLLGSHSREFMAAESCEKLYNAYLQGFLFAYSLPRSQRISHSIWQIPPKEILERIDDCFTPSFWRILKAIVTQMPDTNRIKYIKFESEEFLLPIEVFLEQSGSMPLLSECFKTCSLQIASKTLHLPLWTLTAESDYMKSMFRGAWRESRTPINSFKGPFPNEEHTLKFLEAGLRFLYKNEKLTGATVIPLLYLSHFLYWTRLRDTCVAAIVDQLDNRATVDQVTLDLAIHLLQESPSILEASPELALHAIQFLEDLLERLSEQNVQALIATVDRLREVNIGGPKIALRRLMLVKGKGIDRDDWEKIALLGPFNEISLMECSTFTEEQLAKLSPAHLTILKLKRCIGLKNINKIEQYSNLITLDVSNCSRLPPELLLQFFRLPNIQRLSVRGCWHSLNLRGVHSLSLVSLDLSECSLTIEQLNYLSNFPHLQEITLRKCWSSRLSPDIDYTQVQLVGLPDFQLWAINPSWRKIDIAFSEVNLALVQRLLTVTNVEVLNLQGVRDFPLAVWDQMIQMPSLQELNISYCYPLVTDTQLAHLSHHQHRLRVVYINEGHNEEVINRLRDLFGIAIVIVKKE